MLFDKICRRNGIAHRLTAPRSPTTTGKIERFHQTLRARVARRRRARSRRCWRRRPRWMTGSATTTPIGRTSRSRPRAPVTPAERFAPALDHPLFPQIWPRPSATAGDAPASYLPFFFFLFSSLSCCSLRWKSFATPDQLLLDGLVLGIGAGGDEVLDGDLNEARVERERGYRMCLKRTLDEALSSPSRRFAVAGGAAIVARRQRLGLDEWQRPGTSHVPGLRSVRGRPRATGLGTAACMTACQRRGPGRGPGQRYRTRRGRE